MNAKKIVNSVVSAALAVSMLMTCGVTASAATSRSSGTTTSKAKNAVEFAANLKLGWNLGNTLDATSGSGLSSETSWGQPKATKKLFQYIKKQGFTSVRIPVSWGNHVDSDYNIDDAWMNRVTEVVDYAVDNGLYVIINSHHDCDYYYPSEEHYDDSEEYIEKIWSQVADNFKNYDEHLVFESMNEPRLTGTNKEWWFSENDKDGVESIKCINKLNQVFVDTVRKSGGKNKNRYLMVPSNAASAGNALNKNFEMPKDTVKNHLMVSVHAYSPYDFAMNAGGYSKWSSSKESELKDFMKKLDQKFIKKGYGVVIGEFGATNKNNLQDRVKWAESYTKLAASYGIPCFLWDNGGTGTTGTENFGMIDRKKLKVYYPEILKAMLKSYK